MCDRPAAGKSTDGETGGAPATGPQSSNSASNTLSSMETLDVGENFYSEDEESQVRLEGNLWGRLFPLAEHFSSVELHNSEYTFGRGDECSYSFSHPALRRHPCFLAYSKIHFQITREYNKTGWQTVLEDLSSNGTFINGNRLGKNQKQVLANNDEISLAMKKNRVFVYMDPSANDQQYPQEILQHYIMSRVLGRGACGEVRLAFEKGTCKRFAVKVISKKTFSIGSKTPHGSSSVNNLSSEVMNEVKVLKALKHPCIIQVEEVIDTADILFIVLELVEGGELFDRVASRGQLEEPIAKLLFYQMVCAVKYLHDEGITHRDLKPENVLLATDDEETLIKVTDFGLSKFVDGNSLMKTFCGTPNYLAPEILLTAGSGSYTQAIDCWSLGVILFICLGGYPPFSEEYKDHSLVQQIVKGHYTFPKDVWESISKDAKDLIKKLLVVEPHLRLTLHDALSHPWLKDEEMLAKANRLMFSHCNGFSDPVPVVIPSNRRPTLKRQNEESNEETMDGDVNSDFVEPPAKLSKSKPDQTVTSSAQVT